MWQSKEQCSTARFRWLSVRHVRDWSLNFHIAGDARSMHQQLTGNAQASLLFQPCRRTKVHNSPMSRLMKQRQAEPPYLMKPVIAILDNQSQNAMLTCLLWLQTHGR